MDYISEKFARLGVDNAPGQESRQEIMEFDLNGGKLCGTPVDFSHGDVDAHKPIPGSLEEFIKGYNMGASQAYTEYRGGKVQRIDISEKISSFTRCPIDANKEIIITPGTQCALFLAMGSLVSRGDKVAIVEPDYFANRKLVEFFDGEVYPVVLDYEKYDTRAGLNLTELEEGFKHGVKLFLFSNPNNPTGVIYSAEEIDIIAKLAKKYDATLIVDELYSRQVFDNRTYTHLCAMDTVPDNLVTLMGPSKTESLSGFRLGVAFGSATIIDRMEKLQAIVSLRASGYNQAVMTSWFNEPKDWMNSRINDHQKIRDDLLAKLRTVKGMYVRTTEAGSYLFPKLPEMNISLKDFVKILRLNAYVTVTPGTEFGPQFTDSFRINFSQNHNAAISAIERLILMVERYRK